MLVVEEEVEGGVIYRWSLLCYISQIEPNASPENNSNLGSTAADGLARLNARNVSNNYDWQVSCKHQKYCGSSPH